MESKNGQWTSSLTTLTWIPPSQITHHSTFSRRPSKMCGRTVTNDSEHQRGKMTRGENETRIIKPLKSLKVFSNDIRMYCKAFCCECDNVVTLSGMKKQVKTCHQMTLTEYKELYGDHRKQIIQVVHHKCAFCQSSILFDTDDMSKHLKKIHQTSYREYSTRFLAKSQPSGQATNLQNITKGKEVLSSKKTCETSLVVIRCDQCLRTFKQNIQLKVHKRKHSSQL